MICFIKSTFLSEATSLRDALLSQSVKWKRAAAKKVCDAFLFYHFTWKLMFMCWNNTNMWLIHPLCFFKNDILFLFRAISQKIIKKLSWFLEASCLEINFSCCCFFFQLAVVVGGPNVLLQQPEHNKSPIISRSDEISCKANRLLHSVCPERSVKLRWADEALGELMCSDVNQ